MDQASHGVGGGKSKSPKSEQNHSNCPKHVHAFLECWSAPTVGKSPHDAHPVLHNGYRNIRAIVDRGLISRIQCGYHVPMTSWPGTSIKVTDHVLHFDCTRRFSVSRSKARVLGNRRLANILQLLRESRGQFHRFSLRRIPMPVTTSDTERAAGARSAGQSGDAGKMSQSSASPTGNPQDLSTAALVKDIGA